MRRWLSKNLSLLTLVPIAFLIIFIVVEVSRSYESLSQANRVIADVRLASHTSELLHEIQKERGLSAGFIGSRGEKFLAQLASQRNQTNAKFEDLKQFYADKEYNQVKNSAINQLFRNLNGISNIRSKTDNLNISLDNALAFYTKNNAIILELNGTLANAITELRLAERMFVLYNLAYAKEQSGIERAVLSNVFSQDSFTPSLLIRFISLVSKQDTYLKSAETLSDSDFKTTLQTFNNSRESRNVNRFRDIANNNSSNFNTPAQDWFAAATARIDKLKLTEETLLNQTIDSAEQHVFEAYIIILIELLILVFAITITYAVYSTIKLRSAQAADIQRVMNAVDRDKNLKEEVKIISEDELGHIAELMNLTFLHIKEDFSQFQQNASEISSASLQSSATAEQSKASMMHLQTDIASIASATEEMNASIHGVMESMKYASEGAENAAAETAKGEKAVGTAVKGINQTAEEVRKVGKTIEDLNLRVNDILGMVDVIKSVAEQTNLLALNAAIEAARAGEQGRGFAVVADEVRSLAQRTQQSTEEISNVVDVLRASSQKAFSSIEIGNQQAEIAVKQANEITNVLGNVVTNIKSVDEVTQVISQSTQEQHIVISSITSNVSSIDVQARENVVGAEQLATASYQLSSIAKDMQERLNLYKV